MAEITAKNVSLGYDGKAIACNIDFSVEAGDYLCIVGENGAGKSTLVKALLGLEKPLLGEISFEKGVDAKGIGYLPQQTKMKKDFPATVEEIVLSGALNRCHRRFWFSYKERFLMQRNMKKLGIEALKKKSFNQLSGGQKQRVLIARALCAAEKILLLDEPVAGLDPIAINELYHLIMDINREEKITVIMVSHDVNAAARHAKHILHLGNKETFFGTAEEYKNSDLGKLFLGGGKCGRCEH